MPEKELCLGRCTRGLKIVPHHKEYIHIMRVRFSGDVAAEDNESLYPSCATCQIVDAFQTRRGGNTLRCTSSEVRNDIDNFGSIHAGRQIT